MNTNLPTLNVILVVIGLFLFSCDNSESRNEPPAVTDIDGNRYYAVNIGTQTWLVQNLRTTKYRDGTPIPNVTGSTEWGFLAGGAYCNYNNDTNNVAAYGRLYNWYAVNDSHGLAPAGWHVATDSDWTILAAYLGGDTVAGDKLKESGTEHWTSPNLGATNEAGFAALPGGYRFYDAIAEFGGITTNGFWWAATDASNGWKCYRAIYAGSASFYRSYSPQRFGYSVRCVKD